MFQIVFLHNLHGHSGFHCLTLSLNDSKDLLFFFSGTTDQILGAKYDAVSVTYFIKFPLLL